MGSAVSDMDDLVAEDLAIAGYDVQRAQVA